ncbi:hypothetical protein MMC06_004679 [Schaereria dolodes]|nr:hypothetical protein [Schaereria dolodes]
MAFAPLASQQNGLEMFQKGHVQSVFTSNSSSRSLAEGSDVYDTEFEEDMSDFEEYSGRRSEDSYGKRSDTTLSSFDELITPNSNSNGFGGFDFQLLDKSAPSKPVEGPVGPHLFRISQESSQAVDFYLSMSPPFSPEEAWTGPESPDQKSCWNSESHTDEISLGGSALKAWTPSQVATWMGTTGFEASVIESFRSNDISGATLIDLHYDDLKELGIKSFGQRHRLWNEIRTLRRSRGAGSASLTPIEDSCHSPISSRPSKDCSSPRDEHSRSPVEGQRRARRARRADDVISPAESASIVAIEQLLPKPHKCSKGENCSKWQKQQRKLAKIAKEFPIELQQINDSTGSPSESGLGPASVIVPSVVASSDLLGPAQLPIRLEEDSLRVVQSRDPQENVRQFLTFQHVDTQASEEPTTPPYEMFPPLSPLNAQPPHSNLRSLPKLTIPDTPVVDAFSPNRTAIPVSPVRRGTPLTAMELRDRHAPYNVYRIGSPASAMDVPVTAIPLGPIERDFSSSVPPDMKFGAADPISRCSSRLENRRPIASSGFPSSRGFNTIQRATSNASHRRKTSTAIARLEDARVLTPIDATEELTPTVADVNHVGWMKKRKTRMLRHEWHDNHFRLNGTRLAMHKDAKAMDALEYIDVDDYAVACSSLSSSKLNAAFKTLKLSGKKKDGDAAAFAFQLVPAAEKKGFLNPATGKTHHFAVKSRDERIDWMRELMLAKALRQKGDGYEVNINGNMI